MNAGSPYVFLDYVIFQSFVTLKKRADTVIDPLITKQKTATIDTGKTTGDFSDKTGFDIYCVEAFFISVIRQRSALDQRFHHPGFNDRSCFRPCPHFYCSFSPRDYHVFQHSCHSCLMKFSAVEFLPVSANGPSEHHY